MKSLPLKWHGGKSKIASWIHNQAPPSCAVDSIAGYTHRNTTCFGAGQEFWNWLPVQGISETVNDLNYELMNFWRVLAKRESFYDFASYLQVFPLCESTWKECKEIVEAKLLNANQQIARAVCFYVKYRQSRMGLGKDYATPTRRTRSGMNENVSAWLSAVDGLQECVDRLMRVEFRCMDAIEFIKMYDHPAALFYCDPPYLHGTRVSTECYEYEMNLKQHVDLLECLGGIQGKFMLSGYPSQVYADAAKLYGWRVSELGVQNFASNQEVKEIKTECLWMNY